jgi:hypothetical protein
MDVNDPMCGDASRPITSELLGLERPADAEGVLDAGLRDGADA